MKKTLIQTLAPYKVIATIGSCKNAGKTTVLNHLIESYSIEGRLGITSIGYDGEEKDGITNLPKPRITVYPEMIVATGTSLLSKSQVSVEYLEDTGINTPVGNIHIVKILTKGILEVAGPSMKNQLERVKNRMLDFGCEKVLLDGAAGRLSFAGIADGVVLSVGAAMSDSMDKVVSEASYLAMRLSFKANEEAKTLEMVTDKVYRDIVKEGLIYRVYRGSVGDKDINEALKQGLTSEYKMIHVVNDSTAIFISQQTYHRMKHSGSDIYVRQGVPLKAITINPMSPYGEWFDKDLFMEKMKEAVTYPVYNILNEKVNRNEK